MDLIYINNKNLTNVNFVTEDFIKKVIKLNIKINIVIQWKIQRKFNNNKIFKIKLIVMKIKFMYINAMKQVVIRLIQLYFI